MKRHAPSIFPNRHRFNYDVAIPDRQLWAIGMVAAQWGMVEFLVRVHTFKLCQNDKQIEQQYDNQPDFRHRREMWQTLIEEKITTQPHRTLALDVVAAVKNLKHERDRVMHACWAGGMEANSPSSGGLPTTDGQILGAPFAPTAAWSLNYTRLRKIGVDLAALNQRLAPMCITFVDDGKGEARRIDT